MMVRAHEDCILHTIHSRLTVEDKKQQSVSSGWHVSLDHYTLQVVTDLSILLIESISYFQNFE